MNYAHLVSIVPMIDMDSVASADQTLYGLQNPDFIVVGPSPPQIRRYSL